MSNEKLEKAITLLNNKLSFNFQSIGEVKEISIDEIPVESLAVILQYGTRKLNDRVNSIYGTPKNEETREAIVKRVWNEMLEGKLSERRSPATGQKGFRDWILNFLKLGGIKSDILNTLKGATPEAIVNTVWKNQTDEQRKATLDELAARYEKSLEIFQSVQVELPPVED